MCTVLPGCVMRYASLQGEIGGVHRGGETTMDISADLTELGRTPVAVISSGCKSFLDIPRTLEYLETEGVCVGTFAGRRDGKVDFPAFWTRDSGIKSPLTIHDEAEAAAIICKSIYTPRSTSMFFDGVVPSHMLTFTTRRPDRIASIIRASLRQRNS